MKARWLLVLLLGLVLFAAPAQAFPIIDFGDGGVAGGDIYYDGSNVFATDIPLKSLKVFPGPGMPDSYAMDGLLSFNTQANTISIIGDVPDLGISNKTLLTGSFTKWWLENYVKNQILDFKGEGVDTKDEELLRALGFDVGTPWTFFGFSFTAYGGETPDHYIAYSTDFKNEGKIPEPISLILLGSGLAGAGLYRRFRKPRG